MVSLTMPHSKQSTVHLIVGFRYFVERASAVNLFLPTTNVFQQSTLMADGNLLATKNMNGAMSVSMAKGKSIKTNVERTRA